MSSYMNLVNGSTIEFTSSKDGAYEGCSTSFMIIDRDGVNFNGEFYPHPPRLSPDYAADGVCDLGGIV